MCVTSTTDENGKKSTITLTEAKKKARNSATKANNEGLVKDIYQNVSKWLGDFQWFIQNIFIDFSMDSNEWLLSIVLNDLRNFFLSCRPWARYERNVVKLAWFLIEGWLNIAAYGTMAIQSVQRDLLGFLKGKPNSFLLKYGEIIYCFGIIET